MSTYGEGIKLPSLLKEKKEMEKNLVKVSTYARKKAVSVQSVYTWVKEGKVKSVEIDGIVFIVDEE